MWCAYMIVLCESCHIYHARSWKLALTLHNVISLRLTRVVFNWKQCLCEHLSARYLCHIDLYYMYCNLAYCLFVQTQGKVNIIFCGIFDLHWTQSISVINLEWCSTNAEQYLYIFKSKSFFNVKEFLILRSMFKIKRLRIIKNGK